LAEDGNKVTPAREFLLGRLSEETRSRLEESFFTDDELFEQIEIAEDELIDDYVRNEISAADRTYFEKTLLRSPRIAERVKVARVLASATAVAKTVVQPLPDSWGSRLERFLNWISPMSIAGKFTYATLGLILVVGGPVLSLEYLRLREASQKLQEERAALERQVRDLTAQNSQTLSERNRINAELERQRAENARGNEEIERQWDRPNRSIATFALTLFPGGSRGSDGGDSFSLQETPSRFQFNLLLEADDYQAYRVVVTSLGGKEIGAVSSLKSRTSGKSKIVAFRLSSARFTPGDYAVDLSGITRSGQTKPIATYNFRVLPKAN
jgi:hypothetical protein